MGNFDFPKVWWGGNTDWWGGAIAPPCPYGSYGPESHLKSTCMLYTFIVDFYDLKFRKVSWCVSLLLSYFRCYDNRF